MHSSLAQTIHTYSSNASTARFTRCTEVDEPPLRTTYYPAIQCALRQTRPRYQEAVENIPFSQSLELLQDHAWASVATGPSYELVRGYHQSPGVPQANGYRRQAFQIDSLIKGAGDTYLRKSSSRDKSLAFIMTVILHFDLGFLTRCVQD
jgi:hypothetical protein